MAERLATGQWWALVATVIVTPLAMSTWTFDVFNLAALTVLWFGVTIAIGIEVALGFPTRRLPWLAPAVGCYLAVLVLTTATSRAPAVSALGNYGRYGGLATTVPVIVLAALLAAAAAQSSRRRWQLAAAVVVSAVIGSAFLWLQQADLDAIVGWQLPSWVRPWVDRPRHPPGLLGNSNFSGAHAALGVGPAAVLAIRSWRRSAGPTHASPRAAWVWAAAACICVSGVAVSQSRGAIAATVTALSVVGCADDRWRRVVVGGIGGLAAIVLVVAVPSRVALGALVLGVIAVASRWRRIRRVVLLGAAGAAVLGIGLLVASLVPGVDERIDDLLSTSTWDERVDLWEVALDGAAERPVLGGGPDLYQATFADYAGPSLGGVVSDEPHNVLLDHLDGSGLLGAAAWLAVVAAAVETARHAERRGDLVPWTAMGAGYLAQAMVSIDVVPLQLWGWVALAGILAAADPRLGVRTFPRVRGAAALAALVGVGAVLALAVGPFRADMAHRRGIEASNAGDDAQAVIELGRAVDRHGWEPRFHRRLGIQLTLVANATNDPALAAAARAEFTRALDLHPFDAVARAWLGSLDG